MLEERSGGRKVGGGYLYISCTAVHAIRDVPYIVRKSDRHGQEAREF